MALAYLRCVRLFVSSVHSETDISTIELVSCVDELSPVTCCFGDHVFTFTFRQFVKFYSVVPLQEANILGDISPKLILGLAGFILFSAGLVRRELFDAAIALNFPQARRRN